MTDVPQLTSLEEDLLKELFNLGVGTAGASLSRMVKQEVLLSVPEVRFEESQALVKILSDESNIVTISQYIKGPFDAKSMLLFPEHGGLEVVRQMLGAHLTDETLAELQEEALTEIGNIVLNACIGSISKTLHTSFDVEIPRFCTAHRENLLQLNNLIDSDAILLINIDMMLKASDIKGYLVFVFNPTSLTNLQASMRKLIEALS